MKTENKLVRILVYSGVILFQLIATQLVTFLASFLVPDMADEIAIKSIAFIFVVGLTFTIGIFGAGWLALKLGWLSLEAKLPARLVVTLIGAYLPLIVGLLFFAPLKTGHPVFSLSILAGILGFYIPGWLWK